MTRVPLLMLRYYAVEERDKPFSEQREMRAIFMRHMPRDAADFVERCLLTPPEMS